MATPRKHAPAAKPSRRSPAFILQPLALSIPSTRVDQLTDEQYLARWLVQQGYYDEAIAWTDGLTTEQVAKLDAASATRPIYPYWHQLGSKERNPFPTI